MPRQSIPAFDRALIKSGYNKAPKAELPIQFIADTTGFVPLFHKLTASACSIFTGNLKLGLAPIATGYFVMG